MKNEPIQSTPADNLAKWVVVSFTLIAVCVVTMVWWSSGRIKATPPASATATATATDTNTADTQP